jgi:hypothetical protein
LLGYRDLRAPVTTTPQEFAPFDSALGTMTTNPKRIENAQCEHGEHGYQPELGFNVAVAYSYEGINVCGECLAHDAGYWGKEEFDHLAKCGSEAPPTAEDAIEDLAFNMGETPSEDLKEIVRSYFTEEN